MATTYHDWAEQPTDALKLTRLRQYKSEISAMLGAVDVSADGKAADRNALNQLYQTLVAEETSLLARGGSTTNGGVFVSARR